MLLRKLICGDFCFRKILSDCKNSAQIAMNDSLDGKMTEDKKPDMLKEETLQSADSTCLDLSGSPAGRVFYYVLVT